MCWGVNLLKRTTARPTIPGCTDNMYVYTNKYMSLSLSLALSHFPFIFTYIHMYVYIYIMCIYIYTHTSRQQPSTSWGSDRSVGGWERLKRIFGETAPLNPMNRV